MLLRFGMAKSSVDDLELTESAIDGLMAELCPGLEFGKLFGIVSAVEHQLLVACVGRVSDAELTVFDLPLRWIIRT